LTAHSNARISGHACLRPSSKESCAPALLATGLPHIHLRNRSAHASTSTPYLTAILLALNWRTGSSRGCRSRVLPSPIAIQKLLDREPVPLDECVEVPRFKSRFAMEPHHSAIRPEARTNTCGSAFAGLRQPSLRRTRSNWSGCSLVGRAITPATMGNGECFEHGLAIIRKRKSACGAIPSRG